MAVAFRSSTDTGYVADPKVGTEPAGAASGDVLLATINLEDLTVTAATPPAGWTALTASGLHPTVSLRCWQAYIVRGGSAPSYTWTWTNNGNGVHVVVAYSGADGTTPVDAEGAWTSSTSAVLTASVTTATANAMKIWYGADYNNLTDTTSGMTTRVNAVAANVADALQAGAGASGAHASNSGSSTGFARIVALREAGGGGGAQDTPELRGRPAGLRGQNQKQQLLAQ